MSEEQEGAGGGEWTRVRAPLLGLWHQGLRTEYQLLDSLKIPVLSMLSKEHSGNICVHVLQALGSL